MMIFKKDTITVSREYRHRFIQKVMNETADAVRLNLPGFNIPKYIEKRMRFYGVYSKYLPPDFKQDKATESNDHVSTETNPLERVETSNS